MAKTKVVVDPITRIEGHLRIEAQAENGKITKAWASSTQFRGIETIMQGRDPRDAWAFTQRICGVCTVVHAVASCRAVEDALDITDPAQRQRSSATWSTGCSSSRTTSSTSTTCTRSTGWTWSAPSRPTRPARPRSRRRISPWPNNSATHFAEVQDRVKKFVGQRPARHLHQRLLGPPGLQAPARGQPHGGGALPRGARLAARRDPAPHRSSAARTRTRTSWSAAWPRPSTSTTPPRSTRSGWPTSQAMITRAQRFVEQVYWPDLRRHRRVLQGLGRDRRRHPELPRLRRVPARRTSATSTALLPARHHPERRPDQGAPVRPRRRSRSTSPARGTSTAKRRRGRAAPVGGRDQAEVHRPADAVDLPPGREEVHLDEVAAVRRPADAGRPAGPRCWWPTPPATRTQGHGHGGCSTGSTSGPAALFSTLGRTAAARHGDGAAGATDERTGTASWSARIKSGDTQTFNGGQVGTLEPWPAEAQGYGYLDAPRGALGHWVQIEDGKISPLPVRRAEHLELLAARRQGHARAVRGGADGQPSAGQPGTAARDPPHHPLVRPLHGLRRARARRRRPPVMEVKVQ